MSSYPARNIVYFSISAILFSTMVLDVPPGGNVQVKPITLIDDDLRRIYIPQYQVVQVDPGGIPSEVKFELWQNEARRGRTVRIVGPVVKIGRFDAWGRRNYIFNTRQGPVAVTQGITTLTPRYARVEGLNYVWDMRMTGGLFYGRRSFPARGWGASGASAASEMAVVATSST